MRRLSKAKISTRQMIVVNSVELRSPVFICKRLMLKLVFSWEVWTGKNTLFFNRKAPGIYITDILDQKNPANNATSIYA